VITRILKGFLFILSGIAVGVAFARFSVKDYHHTSIVIKEDDRQRPVYMSDSKGRQVIALSVKNLTGKRDIGFRVEGAEIQSWYPPVVRMPFWNIDVEGSIFRGVGQGRRLPLYLIFDTFNGHGYLEIFDARDGSPIQKVHIMEGGNGKGHH